MHKSSSPKHIKKQLLTAIFACFIISANTSGITQNDSIKSANDSTGKVLVLSDKEKLVRGERLFHGLIYPGNSMKCTSCHNLTISDTLNWNPDALAISEKYLTLSSEDLGKVLLNPAGGKIAEAHKGIKLSPEEIDMIKKYMDTIPAHGMQKSKPDITRLFIFIVASALLFFSLVDLMIFKKIRILWIHLIIIIITTSFITYQLVVDAILLGRSPGYSPDQPIKFSHVVHAGQNGTACIYCHSYAPYSKVSGFPSVNVCMNCHLIVRNGNRSGTFEISKIISAYENKQPIHWIQVHHLPDHAYYNHSQHVNAGGVDCSECHGKVEEMDRIVQVSDLSMGWCVNCHRTREVKFTENRFYSQYVGLSEDVKNGTVKNVFVSNEGGTDCMRCHY